MLALEVNAFLGEIARARSGYGPPQVAPALPDHRSFRRDGPATHVVLAPRLVEAVLGAGDTFLQADIEAELVALDRDDRLHWVRYFISRNPIQLDGVQHKAARSQFMAMFAKASRSLDEAWRRASAVAYEAIYRGETQSPVVFARLCADSFIEEVFFQFAPDFPGTSLIDAEKPSSKSVFAYLRSRARLSEEEEGLGRIAKATELPEEGSVLPMLLSLVVQGRDPMVGTMAAFLNHLRALTPDQRRIDIMSSRPQDVFCNASAVNYTGRRALAAFAREEFFVSAGDNVLIILPPRAADETSVDLSFGHGAHRCAGKALAHQMLGIWLDDLKKHSERIPWQEFVADVRTPSVFEEYRPNP